MSSIYHIGLLGVFSVYLVQGYTIPQPEFVAYKTTGFLLTMQDDDFSSFAFHININQKISESEEGAISGNLTESVFGTWYFSDQKTKLNVGDKLYYTTCVVKDGVRYAQKNGEWTVKELKEQFFLRGQRKVVVLTRRLIEQSYYYANNTNIPPVKEINGNSSDKSNSHNLDYNLYIICTLVSFSIYRFKALETELI